MRRVRPRTAVPRGRRSDGYGWRGDLFVAGAGTAAGVGEYLKAQNPAVRVAAAEPADSPVFSGGVCRKGGAAQLRPFSHTGSCPLPLTKYPRGCQEYLAG